MSYVLSDPDYSPYIASVLHDPGRRVGPMTISLIAAAVTGIMGTAFIVHQIDRLPTVDPDETRPPVNLAALVVDKPAKLEVLSPDSAAAAVQVAYTYAPSLNAETLSAQWTSADASELVATLGEAQGSSTPEAPAADPALAGAGQVIEVAAAQPVAAGQLTTAERTYGEADRGYLIAVPDEELATMTR